MTANPETLKADLELTCAAVLQGALARHLAQTRRPAVFDFRLLAAATDLVPALPDQPVRDTTHQLTLSVQTGAGRIRLTLQALGFAALRQFAGQRARLVSDDLQINRRFGFDQRGGGIIILDDSAAIRLALRSTRVVLAGPDT